jgi:hypothetical protein
MALRGRRLDVTQAFKQASGPLIGILTYPILPLDIVVIVFAV